MRRQTNSTVALFAAALAFLLACGPVRAADDFWSLVKTPGHVVLMRHAEAPGTLDPPGYRLDDCTTQRNLDANGRAQATRIGAAFSSRGIVFTRVLTSAWCRCKETAHLVTGVDATVFPALNSFVSDASKRPGQSARVRQEIDAVNGFEPILMVTHQVVITALTGVAPMSGELVLVKAGVNGQLEVAGRLVIK